MARLESEPSQIPSAGAGSPRPLAPVPNAPTDDATVTEPAVSFHWSAVPDARAYWLEVGRDPEMAQVDFDTYVGPSTTRLTVHEGLPAGPDTYYWRVRARTETGWGPYGSTATFRRRQLTHDPAMTIQPVKGAPVPIRPRDGAPVDGHAATFEWEPVSNAAEYMLQISHTERFDRNHFDAAVGRTTQTTLYDLLPEDGSTYYWRIRARVGDELCPWSHPMRFRASTDEDESTHRARTMAPREKVGGPVMPAPEALTPVATETTSSGLASAAVAVMISSFVISVIIMFVLVMNMA